VSETNQSGISDNVVGAIAYITFVPAIVFLVLPPYNASPYVRFHAWQSIFINVAAVVVSIVLSIVLAFSVYLGSAAVVFLALTWLIWIFWILIWILCAVNALNGKRFKLPIIGAPAEKLANK
jgi:uncharacterized membrane protein